MAGTGKGWRGMIERIVVAAATTVLPLAASNAGAQTPPWAARLQAELAALDAGDGGARLGVVVRDLDGGDQVSHGGDARWYLASMVKLPVAIAVLRGVDRGAWTLDTPLTLRASDLVDGAGSTRHQRVGTPLPLRGLLEQMMVHSDNAASDMLIDLVGVPEVNAVAQSLMPGAVGRITTLGDVRRLVYGRLVPNADTLSGADLITLHDEASDADRMFRLGRITDTPRSAFRLKSLDAAFDAYYAGGNNAGRLDAYADMLVLLADGKALAPATTEHLIGLMERAETGLQRIRAGLPPGVRFAHKTGTQRRRVCDAGLLRWAERGRERRAVIAACVRDERSLERAEATLMRVGLAVCRSGLLASGNHDAATHCPADDPAAARRAVSPRRR